METKFLVDIGWGHALRVKRNGLLNRSFPAALRFVPSRASDRTVGSGLLLANGLPNKGSRASWTGLPSSGKRRDSRLAIQKGERSCAFFTVLLIVSSETVTAVRLAGTRGLILFRMGGPVCHIATFLTKLSVAPSDVR